MCTFPEIAGNVSRRMRSQVKLRHFHVGCNYDRSVYIPSIHDFFGVVSDWKGEKGEERKREESSRTVLSQETDNKSRDSI